MPVERGDDVLDLVVRTEHRGGDGVELNECFMFHCSGYNFLRMVPPDRD